MQARDARKAHNYHSSITSLFYSSVYYNATGISTDTGHVLQLRSRFAVCAGTSDYTAINEAAFRELRAALSIEWRCLSRVSQVIDLLSPAKCAPSQETDAALRSECRAFQPILIILAQLPRSLGRLYK